MGESGAGPVELKEEKRGSWGQGGGRSRNRQRYVQAIVVSPLNKLPLSERLINTPPSSIPKGGAFFTYSWSFFLLAVELLCLQALEALIRRTSPLQAKNSNCK